MTRCALKVRELTAEIDTDHAVIRPVDRVSFDLAPGETFAIVGESGCGKSMTALALLRLLPERGRIAGGTVELGDTDLLRLPEAAMRSVRGRRVAMIFQEPSTSLNPVITVGDQIGEVLRRHLELDGEAVRARVLELLDAVGIPESERRAADYPFQLSGGMRQRVMIALALACEPDVLIADEPTTALDVTIQAQVLMLLRDLQSRRGTAILLITHDLGVVASMAHRVGVMYAGELVEVASREAFFRAPAHPYSRKLFGALPGPHSRGRPLAMIPGQVPQLSVRLPGCRFADRCHEVMPACREASPQWRDTGEAHHVRCFVAKTGEGLNVTHDPAAEVALGEKGSGLEAFLSVRDLRIHFPIRRGILKRVVGHVRAVDGVSFDIYPGRTLALVGESGCGKTTVGKGVVRLLQATRGSVVVNGVDLASLRSGALRRRRADCQIVFQDPFASLNPRMRVLDLLKEGMQAQGFLGSEGERDARAADLLAQVGLPSNALLRYPHEFSGGQRQRIAIARALAVEPRLIVCDEPTSALDVSVQAQVLNLLADLRARLGVAYLFITHNLAVVEHLADEVAVMYLGRIVERGRAADVLRNPRHPYTQALVAAIPKLDGTTRLAPIVGEMPSPAAPPAGCHFHPRCPHATELCMTRYPEMLPVGAGHAVGCHHVRANEVAAGATVSPVASAGG